MSATEYHVEFFLYQPAMSSNKHQVRQDELPVTTSATATSTSTHTYGRVAMRVLVGLAVLVWIGVDWEKSNSRWLSMQRNVVAPSDHSESEGVRYVTEGSIWDEVRCSLSMLPDCSMC